MRLTPDPFSTALKRFWGYPAFRPRQEEIVRALAAGRDVCVVMPTGGGKSLCYQLPAVVAQGRTAVVISPLIALMQDQVAQLRQMGIPAVFLNSAVTESDQREVKRKAAGGEYRLIYVSPERAVMESTTEWLKTVPLSFFAIDEAHCISEWGHDFRPEYRQLSKLRAIFSQQPIAAFTASATRQVRHDIVEQLRLKNPLKSVSSFRRENLRYIVKRCQGDMQERLLLEAVSRVKSGNVIVYSPTIARVGEVIDLLADREIAAIAYHGQMDAATRRTNQEKWMTEEVRILVGTIAFGLGINKPNVRAVIRLGLPDSLEQFYQEAGRAGRDGLPADCYLFWEKRDNGLRGHFIRQIADPQERARAWARYHAMQKFITSGECRQQLICEHFGENATSQKCGACDNCAGPASWPNATVPDANELGTRRAGYSTGLTFSSLPTPPPLINEELREFLREWRRKVAREKMIAAFVVLHDTTLEELCRRKPHNMDELRTVPGIGEKKCEMYGQSILELFVRFDKGERASPEWRAKPSSATGATRELLLCGHTFEEVARIRGRKISSVIALTADLIEKGQLGFNKEWVPQDHEQWIRQACKRLGTEWMKPVKEAVPPEVSYDAIRLVFAQIRREKNVAENVG